MGKYDESNAHVLEDPTLRARNPVKEVLNLPDHGVQVKDYQGRLLVDFQDGIKYEHGGPKTQYREDEDFKSGSWVSATDYVNVNGSIMSGCLGDIKNFLNNGKLDQVVAIVKTFIDEGGYGKDITVGAALILANVSVFSLKPSMHYLNIIMRNVVKVFRKDTVPGSGSGVGGSGMLMEEEEIVKLMEEEEMADLEL
ncbi:reverse transcriptase zinc-binding domain-containing protein [Tanacetum coccineum]